MLMDRFYRSSLPCNYITIISADARRMIETEWVCIIAPDDRMFYRVLPLSASSHDPQYLDSCTMPLCSVNHWTSSGVSVTWQSSREVARREMA